MHREQVKEFLSAFRAHTAEAADPTLREALELATRDPELGNWPLKERERTHRA